MPDGYRVIGGPYADQELAIARGRPDTLYPHILRTVMQAGFMRSSEGHKPLTAPMITEWTGYSVDTIQAWLRPRTSSTYRVMPRAAIRLILHEIKLRDQSKYPWDRLLKLCQ